METKWTRKRRTASGRRPIAQRIRRASDGVFPARELPREARFPGLARNVPSRVRDSPAKPTGGEWDVDPMAAGWRQAQRRGPGAEPPRLVRGGPRVDGGVRGDRPDVAGAPAAEGLRPAPARLRGAGGVQQAAGDFRRGDPKGGGTINENGRRAVAPSEGAQATERGWVFPPADDPHSERGRLRKGGAGGKTKAGETAAPRLPAAPKPAPRKRERLQRRARSPAGDVTGGACEAWRGPWARPIPRERSERCVRPAYK